jgi:ADP-ribose pyrophosphatase
MAYMAPPRQNVLLADARVAYRGPRFEVRTVALPGADGRTVQRDAVVSADAAVVLPLLDADTVVLIRNERFVVGQTLWELPAGTVEPGEDPQVCAARELAEEAGYEADQLTVLTHFYPSPGMCTECMYAFAAQGLRHVGQHLDDNERIEAHEVSLDEAAAMIRRGEIRDGKTIAVLGYYWVFVRGERTGNRP